MRPKPVASKGSNSKILKRWSNKSVGGVGRVRIVTGRALCWSDDANSMHATLVLLESERGSIIDPRRNTSAAYGISVEFRVSR
jgi:hypothetical protein